MPLTGTIFELLTSTNPVLDLRHQPIGAVTKDSYYAPLDADHVLSWPDFTYENIDAAYGHLFEIGPITSDAIQDLRGTPGRIENETKVDDVALLWNYQICRHPIKRAAERIQQDLGLVEQAVSMQHRTQLSKDPKTDDKAKNPDWSILLWNPQVTGDEGEGEGEGEGGNHTTVVVWGDSKCSSKWTSNPERLPFRFRGNWIWPFRQVLTYCINDGTRYGYLLTPEEVVVMRVYEDKSTPQSRWRVQHAAIPWENSGATGTGTLTINLAIWALAMMSLNEGHRPIRTLNQTLPLNVWWEDPSRRKGEPPTYEHHLSGRRVSDVDGLEYVDVRSRPDTIPGMEEEEVLDRRGAKRARR